MKDIQIGFGIDVDAVCGWLGSFGGENSFAAMSRGLFAGEVGIPRLLTLLERRGIKATWFAPGHSVETFPEQMEAVVAAGHELGCHGYSHENPSAMTPEQEEAVLVRSIEILRKLTGIKPTGYTAPWWDPSPATLGLLTKYGFTYDHSLMHRDFEPYYLREGDTWTKIDYSKPADVWMKPLVRGHETSIVEIPGSWYLDDLPPMMFVPASANSQGWVNPWDIRRQWEEQFEWVYEEMDYAIFPIAIHPDVSGRPQVLRMLNEFISFTEKFEGVRWCTYGEMVESFAGRVAKGGAASSSAALS